MLRKQFPCPPISRSGFRFRRSDRRAYHSAALVGGIAIQVREDRFGNSANDPFIAGDDGFMTDIKGRLVEVEGGYCGEV